AQLTEVLLQKIAAVRVEAFGVRVDKALVGRSQRQQHAADGVQEGNVPARRHRQKQVRVLGGEGTARVDNNDLLGGPRLLARANAVEGDGVGLGHVAADDENDIGQFNVVIAA